MLCFALFFATVETLPIRQAFVYLATFIAASASECKTVRRLISKKFLELWDIT